jgi:tetratricopeptide (TPR) repeat protein
MIQADRKQNVETAVERLTQLRDQADRKMPARSRAEVLQSLGTLYQDRIAGDPATNAEQAVENLNAALSAWDLNKNPDEWASAANNLANAYRKRIRGNHSENMEQAIAYAEAALAIRARSHDAAKSARTACSLATMYIERPFGDKAENIEKSIKMSRFALGVETKDADPASWASNYHNLGEAYLQREQAQRADNIQAALSCFRDALSVRSEVGDLRRQGASLIGLGQALTMLGEETGDQEALADAVAAYQQAAVVSGEADAADQQASACYLMARTLSELPGTDSTARALDAARQCLPAWDAGNNPLRAPLAYAMLAELTSQLGLAAEAYEWICRAIEANEALYAGSAIVDSKLQVVEESAELYIRAADLALRSGAPGSDALLFAERGRARMLSEASVRIQPDWGIPAELLGSESALEAERDRAWAGVRAVHPASAAVDGGFAQIWDLTRQLAALRENIRQFPGGNEYMAARTGSMSWGQIRRWVEAQPPGFALLEYVVLAGRVVAFVVRQDEPEPAVVDIPLDSQALVRCAQAVFRELDGSSAGRLRKETWDRVAQPLVTLVQPKLAGIGLLCIVPHLLLYQLPLHAIGPAGATLLDQMAVYYAPSAGLAIQLSQRVRRDGQAVGPRALVVGDSDSNLPSARQEAEQIGQILGVQPLVGSEATYNAVVAQLSDADVAHFACHGFLRVWDPDISAIRLAGGAELTAKDLRRIKLSCDLGSWSPNATEPPVGHAPPICTSWRLNG